MVAATATDRQDNDPRDGGDHAASQQRPAGSHGAGAEPGEAAEEVGRGQARAGERDGDGHSVRGVDSGQHLGPPRPRPAGRQEPAEHAGEGGYRDDLERDADREPHPAQMGQHLERPGHVGVLGRGRDRQESHGRDGGTSRNQRS
jgi:hypothetical protein